jgi:hypothetical protein
VKIVRRMHKELKEERERMARMNASKASPSLIALEEATKASQADEDKNKAEFEDNIKERKVIKSKWLLSTV